MTSILITGANGFVGRVLCATLKRRGFQVKAAVRNELAQHALNSNLVSVVIGNINGQTDWRFALAGIDVVIHLAARAHVMQETVNDVMQVYRSVNADGTKNLAQQAAASGVKRFIFLSTIKVLGEYTLMEAFHEKTPVNPPQDAYALSKWEAEQGLQHISEITGMQVVVVRPPLVYGEGVKGNFLRLMQLVKQGWPLPFASIHNERSLVYVENLCDLLAVCILHPVAVGRILMCTDGVDFSTPALIRQLSIALDVPVRLFPLPVKVMKKAASLMRKSAEVARLCDSLKVNSTQTQHCLNWQPPFAAEQGIAKTVAYFLRNPE